MSKELVVSSNRHETRVAVLEDDQVVEVYYQRENEYSLAGSIHKGRVTRVLPGMQSAFVDIGLERDAFLYVSDFFEDNEEYEKVVSSVEEKVLKMDRPASPASVSSAPVMPDPIAAPVEQDEAASAAIEEPPAAAPMQEQRREGRDGREGRGRDRGGDDRDARGRRSRRRRSGNRGPRLPESKFFTPNRESEETPVEVAPERPTSSAIEDDDFFVLPGESLAKYRGGEQPDEQDMSEEFNEGSETPVETVADDASPMAEDAEVQADVRAEAPAPHEPEPPVKEPEPEPEPPAPIKEPEPEPVVESTAANASINEAIATEMAPVGDEPQAAPEESPEGVVSAEAPFDAAAVVEQLQPENGEAAEDSEVDGETEEGAIADSEAPVEDGPEPARIPTSLTATLREHGPRYLHRVSRRMRRKGRDGREGREGREPREGRENRQNQPPVEGAAAPEQAREQGREQQREVRTEQRQPREARESRERERTPQPSISELLREGQEIIIQIAKEPLGQKGARITSHIALPGRFLVYMPTVDHVGVSRKIGSDDERLRLKKVLQSNRVGMPGGFIVRTAGEGRSEEELKADMMFLYNLWLDLRQKAEKRPAPALIHHDLDVVQRILRDQVTSAFKTIWVDNEEVYESVLRFVQRFQPGLVNRVKLYTRPTPIFDQFGITGEIEKALRPKVWLKSGGYIVINQTEALVAIDINTGKYVGKSNRLEDTIVKINTDAIKEIVRQIRLRDLGGIIVVDFIDMDERKNRQKVMQALEEAMRADRAPYKILQFNDFGLVAITRKRVKQSLERTLCAPCPSCEGAGYVKSVHTVIGEILIEAQKIAKAVEGDDVMLRVNPEVAKVLKSSKNNYLQEMEEILGNRTVIVKSDPLLHQEKFDLA